MARQVPKRRAQRFTPDQELALRTRLGKSSSTRLLVRLASIAEDEAARVARVRTKQAALERHLEAARALQRTAGLVVSSMAGTVRIAGEARNLGFLPIDAASTIGDLLSESRSRRIPLPLTWSDAGNEQDSLLAAFANIAKQIQGIAERWEKSAQTRFARSEREWIRRIRIVSTRQVAAALREAGARPTKSVDGVLAAVMAIVHEAAGVAIPVGIYRDIAAALPKRRTTRKL